MEQEVKEKVGFLESGLNRKSNSRLTIAICAGICIYAALIEGAGKIVSIIRNCDTSNADWEAVAYLVGALLLGTGLVKGAQRINLNLTKEDKND